MRPAPNGQMPAIARNSVDLPAPDGPVTSTRSPAEMTMSSAATSGAALRQVHHEVLDPDGILAGVRRDVDPGRRGRGGLRALDRDIETVEPRDHRPPFRELPVRIDEKRQRGLHAAEGGRRLHQAAELDRAGEIRGADDDEGKDGRYLGIARGEEGQLLGARMICSQVADQPSEAVEQSLALIGLAAQEGDLLGILPHPNEVEAEVGFEPLLAEIEPDQRPADRGAST